MDSRVIFHIDELPKWNLLLNNVINLLASYDDRSGIRVEVLANSEAVKGYAQNGSLTNRNSMEALSQKNVIFAACNNALIGMNLSREQLFPFVRVVPVGVRELIEKQQEGYAYIKP